MGGGQGFSTSRLVLGLWLVAVGVWALLWDADIVDWRWIESYGFAAMGALTIGLAIRFRTRRLFLGTCLLMTGIFNIILANAGIRRLETLWPAYLVILGLALLIHSLAGAARWVSLVSGTLIAAVGMLGLLSTLLRFSYDFEPALRLGWPLGLVLSGVVLITVGWLKRRTPSQ
jgi:hypothetical protein